MAESVGQVGETAVKGAPLTSLRRNNILRSMERQQTMGEPDVRMTDARLGFRIAPVGTEHAVRFETEKGSRKYVTMQLRVRDVAQHQDLEREGKLEAVCISCQKFYSNSDALMADHLPEEELRKRGECHVICDWSGETAELLPDAQALVDQGEETVSQMPDNVSQRVKDRWRIKHGRVPIGLVSGAHLR